ncbi:MAG: NTP transferase domain-containing protein [Pseudomonadota bacterium]|nr:NTP transferase domain-containing protein [Pseudomonadota bacterium]
MSGIDTAVVLAAGAGSRLQRKGSSKPLCPVAGKPLIDRAIEGLARSGIRRTIVVTGYAADALEEHLAAQTWPAEILLTRTPDWRLPNGVSALAAAPLVGDSAALLVMCDHLVDARLYDRVREAGEDNGLQLGIDRRLGHPWVDPDDVTCVRTNGTRILAIGKGLEPHDAYDTGIFAVGPGFFDALSGLESPSLTEGVRLCAEKGAAGTVDCSDLDWIDIDDAAALAKAEQAIRDGHFR